MRPDRPQPRRSGPAIVVSLGVHALALAALVLSVRLPPPPPDTPAVQVSLIDLGPQTPLLRPVPQTPRAVTPRPASAPPADAPPPPSTLRGAAEPPQPPPAAATPQEYMSFFAERVVGCEREALILLSPAELERCRARIAAVEAMKPRSFRNADAPDLGRLPGLVAEWRLALDRETARRERNRGGAGAAPTTACVGRGSNFGIGCLPEPSN